MKFETIAGFRQLEVIGKSSNKRKYYQHTDGNLWYFKYSTINFVTIIL
jgi:hypothetical protein